MNIILSPASREYLHLVCIVCKLVDYVLLQRVSIEDRVTNTGHWRSVRRQSVINVRRNCTPAMVLVCLQRTRKSNGEKVFPKTLHLHIKESASKSIRGSILSPSLPITMTLMDSSGRTVYTDNKNSSKRCIFQNVQFSLAIVRNPFVESEHFGKWLAVNETKGRGWWVPAGAVEKGETFLQACLRECAEEAGMNIQVKGILRVDHSVSGDVCRTRVIYYGEPTSLAEANNYKIIADAESVEARWVSIDELLQLAATSPGLRGRELVNWAMYLENNGHVFPLEMFGEEGELQPLGSQSVALRPKSEGNTFFRQPNEQYNTRVSNTITAEQRQFMEWANAKRKEMKFSSV